MKNFYKLVVAFLISFPGFSQMAIEWEKNYGGTNNDNAYWFERTDDGGYITIGATLSSDGDVSFNHGMEDIWLIKTDSIGNMEWEKSLGGSNKDIGYSIAKTNDGGYVITGQTKSIDGDVTSYFGVDDIWVAKLDSAGSIEWEKTLGGTMLDDARSIQQTSDGGYILAGSTESTGGQVTGNHGLADCWVVKLDSVGSIVWQKALGGTDYDFATTVRETNDGGYIVTGMTRSSNGDVSFNNGIFDVWLVKLNSLGAIQWEKTYGGAGYDRANCVYQTGDGGYILGGRTISPPSGDVTVSLGGFDCWVVKTDSLGNLQWQKSFGGSLFDAITVIKPTFDGGYVFTGVSESNDIDLTVNKGLYDVWVVKIDSVGNLIWQKSLGGSGNDYAFDLHVETTGEVVVVGWTQSTEGDVTANNGGQDFWMLKLILTTDITLIEKHFSFNLFPNPTKDEINISLNLVQTASKVELQVINTLGQSLKRISVERLEAGENKIIFVTDDFTEGIYYLTLEIDGIRAIRKFVKL